MRRRFCVMAAILGAAFCLIAAPRTMADETMPPTEKASALKGELAEVEKAIQKEKTKDAPSEERMADLQREAARLRDGLKVARDEAQTDELGGMKRALRRIEKAMSDLKAQDPSDDRDATLRDLEAEAERIRHLLESQARPQKTAKRSPLYGDAKEPTLEIILLKRAPAEHVARLVMPFLPDGSRMAPDERTNKLILMTSPRGHEIARRIIEEIDLPAAQELAATPMSAREPMARPRYDYEMTTTRRAYGDMYGEALRQDLEYREREVMPFERTTGVIVAADDAEITVQPNDADAPITFRLPKTRVEGGDWKIVGSLASKVGDIAPEDEVIVEWWEAEGVRYVEDIAPLKQKLKRKEETFLLD